MGDIKESFKTKAEVVGAEIKALLKEHGDKKIGEVTSGTQSPCLGIGIGMGYF